MFRKTQEGEKRHEFITSALFQAPHEHIVQVVSTLLYDPGILILIDHFCHVGFLWTLPLTTRSQTFVPHSPFPVPNSPFPVPPYPLPVPGSRLRCSPVHFCVCLFVLLSHSGFSRNTSNGNPGSINSFPTNKVHLEEKKQDEGTVLESGAGFRAFLEESELILFIINVFFTWLVIFGDL